MSEPAPPAGIDLDIAYFGLDSSKHQLEQAKLDLDTQKFKFEQRKNEREFVVSLLKNVKYLNGIQDDRRTTITKKDKVTVIETKGRTLYAHEEDLYNFSLIMMKCLIAKDYDIKPKEFNE